MKITKEKAKLSNVELVTMCKIMNGDNFEYYKALLTEKLHLKSYEGKTAKQLVRICRNRCIKKTSILEWCTESEHSQQFETLIEALTNESTPYQYKRNDNFSDAVGGVAWFRIQQYIENSDESDMLTAILADGFCIDNGMINYDKPGSIIDVLEGRLIQKSAMESLANHGDNMVYLAPIMEIIKKNK